MILIPLARLAFGLWIGAVACVAFVVAPRVFGFFDDPSRAGELMVPIFRSVDWFGMGAALLFALAARARRWRALSAAALGGAAAVNLFGLSPRIAVLGSSAGNYHKASEALWGVILVAGAVLTLLGPGRPRSRPA